MKPASSVTKVSEEDTKTKKLNLTKNSTTNKREPSKLFQRMKSHEEGEPELNATTKPPKPKSSLGRRPLSSQKYVQALGQTTTTSNAKSEDEIKQIVTTVFTHSKKLQNFTSKKSLDQDQAFNILINNELFILSLVSVLSNKNPQQINKYVQRTCIHKLDRMLALEKQKNICQSLETKIEQLIDKRIKSLSQFS